MFPCIPILFFCIGVSFGQVLGSSRSNEEIGVVPERFDESNFQANATMASITEGALVKAAEYFKKQRDTDYSWGEFTPRAVVAMSFASRVIPMAAEEKELMQKQLNVQLLLDLMQDRGNMSLSRLALYINALYATCQDPRHFQGLDLVARLRLEERKAANSNSSIPLAYLTLCLAGELTGGDALKMATLYNSLGYDRVGSRALLMMAMECYMNKEATNNFEHYVNHFFSSHQDEADVYTKSLFMQATLAAKRPIVLQKLLSEQRPDGSFGDMLATYYAIPVLMNSSLLDLKCNTTTTNTGMGLDNLLVKRSGPEYHVAYSLWISTDDVEVNSHHLTLTYDGDKSFFEVMLMAAVRDPLFQFLYDETSDGKQVYSIAGIPNDSENGKLWMLYSGTIDKVTVNSVQNLTLQTDGVDKIFPDDQSHFVFWLKRDHVRQIKNEDSLKTAQSKFR